MGFEKASMRRIADRCGMTAAGIYRHCADKEDLFYQLVSPADDKLMAWARAHMKRYEEPVKKNRKVVWRDSFIDMMREVVYPDMEDYHLLVARSKGSKYENYLHDMTQMAQEYAQKYAAFMQYLDEKVMDHVNGSWFHQLDRKNNVLDTVWPGKSDLYHALQAMLIPYYAADLSIAPAVKLDKKV